MPNKASHFQRNHDIILWYRNSKSSTFNVLRGEYSESSKRTYERAKRIGYNANLKKRMVTVFDREKYLRAVKDGKLPYGLQEAEFQGTGVPLNDVWSMPILAPASKERTGYPTQKPLALYRRMIEASSNEGDIVLDPFAGLRDDFNRSRAVG